MVNWRFSSNLSEIRLSSPFNSLFCCCSVSKSCLTLWPHELQNTRLPCPSLATRVCSNSCPLSRWCHPTISSSVVPFSCCLQSFPASGSFSSESALCIRWQSTGTSASASVLTMNIQGWFPLGLTARIDLTIKTLKLYLSVFCRFYHCR